MCDERHTHIEAARREHPQGITKYPAQEDTLIAEVHNNKVISSESYDMMSTKFSYNTINTVILLT